ncbi:hypothetical protein JCM11491_001894 [Sporobolomyces phaffii]
MAKAITTPDLNPPEGHASRFFRFGGDESSPPRPGIPVEAFLAVADHLSEADLVQASHVCSNWRKALLSCSRLWTDLGGVNVASMTTLDRVRAFVSRSKGKLRRLAFDFAPQGDLELSMVPVLPLLRQMFHEISRLDGARALRYLTLDLQAYRNEDDVSPAYKAIALAVQFAEFSAVNLTEFHLVSVLPRFPAGAPFWFSLPSLKKISISCRGPENGTSLPDFFSTRNAVAQTQSLTSSLRSIFFVNTSLQDVTYPTFTHLTRLKLYEMNVLNLYGLLSKCAATLEILELRQTSSDSPSKYLVNSTPNTANAANKDAPPVLSLPSLEKVQICGIATPLLWLAPSDAKSSFMCDTPSLAKLDFGPKVYSDVSDDGYDDEDDQLSACQALDTTLLLGLFRRSPQLAAINFKRTNLDESMLIASLPSASNFFTHLSIGGTLACTDSMVERLPQLVPQLRELDVYDSGWVGSSERTVSVQALGRFVVAMQQLSPDKRPAGLYLEITADGDFRNAETTPKEKRTALKDLLVAFSASQLSHLGSQLRLNPGPTLASTPASTLSFSAIKAELDSLVTPPASPPYARPFPAKPGEPGYVKPETNTVGTNGEAKRDKKKGRKKKDSIAAPKDIVDKAEALLQQWVTQREQEACEAWFEELEQEGRVEIRWGSACGSLNCDCCVGGEMWRSDDEDSSDEDDDE